jgi:transcriptional regulator GlxA family with amidase domain
MAAHRVCFLIYPGVASFDVAGPAQALRSTGLGHYQVVMASVDGGSVETDCAGVAFTTVAANTVTDPIDTLFLPGGNDAPAAARDPALIRWVRTLARRAGRIACICTGAFLAAEAGLLDGHRAATHWRFGDEFARRFQKIRLERDPIWIKDGRIYSSAGVSAGVDLTLALIEEDLGIQVALQAARELVVFFKRPGGQSQYSNLLAAQISNADGPLQKTLAWLADHLGADIRPQMLADKARMSLRTFTRACIQHTGMTPTKLIETLRVQAAREAIETSDVSFETIAVRYGFGGEQRLRRAFLRQLEATPADIRSRLSQ